MISNLSLVTLNFKLRSDQPISRILYPVKVTSHRMTIIHLGRRLPDTSSDLPGNTDGLPLNVPLFGLAPGGVYKASPVTRRTGALLPHLFTLTWKGLSSMLDNPWRAVCFLLHFPSRHRDSTLWSTLPCGVRTFLRACVFPKTGKDPATVCSALTG